MALGMDAQQIDLGTGDIDFMQLPFNREFISNNGISAIHVEEQVKRSSQPIRMSGVKRTYSFDADGQCTARSSYRQRYGLTDTIFEVYRISPNDNVLQYDRKDRGGFYRETFEHSGDTLTVCSYRGKSYDLEATWISCEHQVTSRTNYGDKTLILNENHLPYKSRERYYNSSGYLERMVESYLISLRSNEVTYQYNDRGKLSFRRRLADKGNEEWSYVYGDDGLLAEVYYRIDGNLKWRRTIVQDDFGRIAAILTLDPGTEDISIDKFTYEFTE